MREENAADRSVGSRVTRWGSLLGVAVGGGALLALWSRAGSAAAVPSFLVATAGFAVLLGFAAFTWRRLRQLAGRQPNSIAYDVGVRRFGIGLGVAGSIWLGLKDSAPLSLHSFASPELLFRLVVCALVQIPVAMWAGWMWGRRMAG